MFVRVKRRWLKSSDDARPDFSLRLYVVENRRIKKNPRQKVIAYLGSIRRSELAIENKRTSFVKQLSFKLGALTNRHDEAIRLKKNLIACLVHEQFSHWSTSTWTDSWHQQSSLETLKGKLEQARAHAAAAAAKAADSTERTIWAIRRSGIEKELQKRRS